MQRPTLSLAFLALAALGAGCTVHQTEPPPLTGPSEFALSLAVSVTPDIINQDGASQSAITVTARDANARPISGLAIHLDMLVERVPQDFGTLSARNIATGADGRATAMYTAPPPPPPAAGGAGSIVTIGATPKGSNFQTAVPQTADIRLVPPGVILPPADTPTPAFTYSPTAVNTNVPVIFDASASCPGAVSATGACASSGTITRYSWNFGDGTSGASQVVTHTFTNQNTFSVTLTVTNDRGVSASITRAVSVSTSAAPTASFVFSPAQPVVGQSIVFNADASKAAPGHTIVQFSWIWGDGTPNGEGFLTQHTYATSGTYNVTLTVRDDTDQRSTATQGVTVGSGTPTASFTFAVTNPATHTLQVDGSASVAFGGSTITGYTWLWGDGATDTGSAGVRTHTYAGAGTYTVRLTVTDSIGRTGSVSNSITVP